MRPKSLPVAATTEITTSSKVHVFSTETTEVRTFPRGVCRIAHTGLIPTLRKWSDCISIHRILALRLLFLFPCHSSQFITQEASTQSSQSTGHPGVYATLWRITRAVHRSSNIPIGIIAGAIGGCTAAPLAHITRIG